jgi:two-component system nitrogen regulation response regulator GlnG
MAAIPRELIESELFGHEKGAFTGAQARAIGRFEQADTGTLFLDEIGDMPMEAQTRLLRVLQEGEYMTVGGRTPIKTDVRIIAATNKALEQQINQGLFREDLFYRLNVVPLRLPALRERLEDISDLVHHFLQASRKSGLPQKMIQPDALEALKRHNWPGNVRELENLVQRLSALYSQEVITADIIGSELSSSQSSRTFSAENNATSLNEWMESYLTDYFSDFGETLPPPGLYDRILREIEGPLITASLAATRGNQIRAAELLGLNRNTLRKKIRDHKLRIVRTPA